jgi:hypothetical protein
MKEVARIQASITGAFILVLLFQLTRSDYNRASVIRLNQRIRKILREQSKVDRVLADEAYETIKLKYLEDKIELDIGILIETLAFNKEDYMKQLFGNDIITYVERAAAKITLPDLTPKQRKDSYMIADELKDSLEKIVFEHKVKK